MFKIKKQSVPTPQVVEMTALTSFPRAAEFRKLEKYAFELWMLYRSLDMRVHQLAELTLKKEQSFIISYKSTHLGRLPDKDDFKDEIARLAALHIESMVSQHGGISRDELYISAGLQH